LSKSDEYSYEASGKKTIYARFTKLYKPYLSFVSKDAILSESAESDDGSEILSVKDTPFIIGSHNVNSNGDVVITGENGGEKYGNTISTGFVGTIEGTLDEIGKYKNIVWSISVPVGEDVKTDVTEAVGKSRALEDNETVSVARGATYLKVSGNTNDYPFELQKTKLTDNASYNAGTICKSLDGSEREISVYDSLPIMSGDAKITISIGVILDDIYAPDATATLSLTSDTAASGAIDASEDDLFESSRYGYFHVDKDSVFGASEKNPYVNGVQTKEK
jgi:hypothetical protein